MKKFAKYIWIIGGALCLVGLLIGVLSFAFLGFEPNRITNSDYKKEVKRFDASTIQTIQTDLSERKIIVNPTNSNEIVITYFTIENDKIFCEENGGVISATTNREAINWFNPKNWFNFRVEISEATFTMVIDVPKNYAGSFDLETSNSKITLDNFKSVKQIEAETSNSSISLADIDCDDVNVKSSNGNVEIENVNVNNELWVKTSNDKISIKNAKAEAIQAGTNNGKIQLENVEANGVLWGKTSNATIEVSRVAGSDIQLKTSNGKISGEIMGKATDYSIISDTNNGDSNLSSNQNGTTDKRLSVDTNNANIDINFSQDN